MALLVFLFLFLFFLKKLCWPSVFNNKNKSPPFVALGLRVEAGVRHLEQTGYQDAPLKSHTRCPRTSVVVIPEPRQPWPRSS